MFAVIVLMVVSAFSITDCQQCLKNEDIGNVEGNTYECTDPDEPECCENEGQFTCCQVNQERNVREQVILWSSVAAFILIAIIIITCIRKDIICCKKETLKESLSGLISRKRSYKNGKETLLPKTPNTISTFSRDYYRASSVTGRSSAGDDFAENPYDRKLRDAGIGHPMPGHLEEFPSQMRICPSDTFSSSMDKY